MNVSVELLADLESSQNTQSKKSIKLRRKSYMPPNKMNRKIITLNSHRAGYQLPTNAPQNSLLLGPLQSPGRDLSTTFSPQNNQDMRRTIGNYTSQKNHGHLSTHDTNSFSLHEAMQLTNLSNMTTDLPS